jgi:hypothetical protein
MHASSTASEAHEAISDGLAVIRRCGFNMVGRCSEKSLSIEGGVSSHRQQLAHRQL